MKNGFGKAGLERLTADDWALLVPTAMKFSANVCGSLYNYVDPDFADSI